MSSAIKTVAKPITAASPNGNGVNHPTPATPQTVVRPVATYVTIGVLADVLDDIEHLRISTSNRYQALIADPDENEGERGGSFGKKMPEWLPEIEVVHQQLAEIQEVELAAVKRLEKAMRSHPLGKWQRETKGVGAKQLARLLGAIGDPAERATVSKLWAYCGWHVVPTDGQRGNETHIAGVVGVAPRHKKGEQSNWSTKAKSRTYLIAASCLKAGGPFREVYDKAKAKYVGGVHATNCSGGHTSAGNKVVFSKCKVTNPETGEIRYAEAGDPLAPSHVHARAMRIVCKEILKALWVESRHLSE